MSFLIYLAPLFAVGVALGALFLLTARLSLEVTPERFESINGMRGYLAFFVFLHHSMIWYFYLQYGHWERPSYSLYAYFGTGSVILFFMITSFLFTNKILQGPVDWLRLYVSRALRIGPLYLIVVLSLFVLVAYTTGWHLQISAGKLLGQGLKAVSFGIFTPTDINGFMETNLITAGVLWTLPYEWFFYFLLPAFALILMRTKAPLSYFIFPAFAVYIYKSTPLIYMKILPFLGGILAAFLIDWPIFKRLASSRVASYLIIGVLLVAILFYADPLEITPQILLAIVFMLIASGNTIFGIFSAKISKLFGEISYSIYLLHGILLYVVFKLVIGVEVVRDLTPIAYCLLILGLCPILILLSLMSYLYIEKPSMKRVSELVKLIRGLF